MANTPTLSLRVPPGQHQLVRDVVARLKSDAGFADTLRTLLTPAGEAAAVQDGTLDVLDLGRRLDAVERQVAEHSALLAIQPALQGGAGALPGMPALQASGTGAPENTGALQAEEPTPPAVLPRAGTASPEPAEPWTTGDGRTKRLTPAGVAELDRRLQAGEPVAVIAKALGISVLTVRKRRKGRVADD